MVVHMYIFLLVGNFPGCLWGGPGFEVDFCLEPCIHSGSTRGFLFGSVKKSVGNLPGHKSACGEPPANRMTGLHILSTVRLSGPLWASLAFLGLSLPAIPQAASQPAKRVTGSLVACT